MLLRAESTTPTWQGVEAPRRYEQCLRCGEFTLLGDEHICAAK
jgi:hypothetical protein